MVITSRTYLVLVVGYELSVDVVDFGTSGCWYDFEVGYSRARVLE
jgi:hypothetical protein